MIDTQLASAKTALPRTRVSAPLRWLLDNDLIKGQCCNYGEGKAQVDTDAMDSRTGFAIGYDPNTENWYMPQGMRFNTIYCGYVLNTLDVDTSSQVISDILDLLYPGGIAYFAVRLDKVDGDPYLDGVITKRGTFQTHAYRILKDTCTYLHKTSHYGIFTEEKS